MPHASRERKRERGEGECTQEVDVISSLLPAAGVHDPVQPLLRRLLIYCCLDKVLDHLEITVGMHNSGQHLHIECTCRLRPLETHTGCILHSMF